MGPLQVLSPLWDDWFRLRPISFLSSVTCGFLPMVPLTLDMFWWYSVVYFSTIPHNNNSISIFFSWPKYNCICWVLLFCVLSFSFFLSLILGFFSLFFCVNWPPIHVLLGSLKMHAIWISCRVQIKWSTHHMVRSLWKEWNREKN